MKLLIIQFARPLDRAEAERIELWYGRHKWPRTRLEAGSRDLENPCSFGWAPSDDWFNLQWQRAAIRRELLAADTVAVSFQPLHAEMPETADYPVTFRRALAFRLDGPQANPVRQIRVFTDSPPTTSTLRIELDRGRHTPARFIGISTYNATTTVDRLDCASTRWFDLTVRHMLPAHRYSGDDGHVTFTLDDDQAFTVSLSSLYQLGPIWFEPLGVYLRRSEDPTSFDEYRARFRGQQTINQRVLAAQEQSLAGALNGQPNPHAVSYILACPLHPQRFRLEINGDLVMERWPVVDPPARPNPRFRNTGLGRMFFGLDRWIITARHVDPAPSPAHNLRARLGQVVVEQKAFAAPLGKPFDAILSHDDTVVAMVRFTFTNMGQTPAPARLSVRYSSDSARSRNPRDPKSSTEDDHLVPRSRLDPLIATDGIIASTLQGESVLRCMYQSTMTASAAQDAVQFHQQLLPGQSCQLLLKVPYVAVDQPHELQTLKQLDFDASLTEANEFWARHCARGAQVVVPEPRLNELHLSHLMHVAQTDLLMPDGSGLINTSVGTSTYGNFSNESCMIIHDLHERGLFDEARKRLELWIKYQGTAPQPGNFTDYKGMYYGAAGFERGAYNQHHGWVLWCLAEHYLFTRDQAWLRSVADSMIAGCDWVFRQRKNTMQPLPHSRGWERGFLPAGSLEDATDFYYWLSTNSLTWRGVAHAAAALAKIDHHEAPRLLREAEAYRRDLIRGFEINRKHSPVVRLRDGRWVPHYPSRLYCRGRDIGWIRETLEGAVYLLISGLYSPTSQQASWILDDYQDNRYPSPPFGYAIPDFSGDWFCRAGFSIQPNLLAGLMPHLDRDEPQIAIWMFFNAFAACYREQIGAMVEHPMPQLGYSNNAHFKTSDQANSLVWLRHLLVHYDDESLYFGRAMPRAWLADGQHVGIRDMHTPFGRVSLWYESRVASGRINASLELALHQPPARCLLRVRDPQNRGLRSVSLNGQPCAAFDPKTGDIDLSGMSGRIEVVCDLAGLGTGGR
ncbi:hypothetical protein [Fontivita pretiosa]|uniref:hypothetical protein n=1 Tax=Fontivita pretiosa TaxID=2989684 RepID=UPI003D167FB9